MDVIKKNPIAYSNFTPIYTLKYASIQYYVYIILYILL